MEDNQNTPYEYMRDHYRQLIGYKITGFTFDDEGFPSFVLTKRGWMEKSTGQAVTGDQIVVQVSRDGEGNGPGHLFIGQCVPRTQGDKG